MFAPPRLDVVVLTAFLMGTTLVHAQSTSSSKTLGDLIDQAKRNKSLNSGNGAADPFPPMSGTKPSKPATKNAATADTEDPADKPMLWSLVGMNSQMVAEIIYKEKVHTLLLHNGEKRIGPWLVERYGASGLYLVPAKTSRKTPNTPGLFLAAPTSGTSVQKYASALPAPLVNLEGAGEGYPGQMGQNLSKIMPPSMLGEPSMPTNAPVAAAATAKTP
jgi:hypothetical protein